MRRPLLLVALPALLLPFSLAARAEDPPKDLPKPPTTPLPDFDNPLWDAKVGETLLYRVRPLDGSWTRWFEERVLARDATDVLIETVETNAEGTKTFAADRDPRNSGWRPLSKEMKLGPQQSWRTERQKDEIVYVGDPVAKAVRATHRVIEEDDPEKAPGVKRQREIWYSHDAPCTGRVKMFPAQRGGERLAFSWDKVLPADECANRAALYPKEPPPGKEDGKEGGKEKPGKEGGMEEPGMDGGMTDGGMAEPGMSP